MKRNTQNILLFVFCIAITFGFYNFSLTNAQTTPTTARPPQIPPPTPPTLATPPPLPEEDNDVIKIETDLVNLSVRVVDRNNRAINNLTQADFKVYEENILQPIEFFSKSEVPTNYSLVIDNSGSLRFQLEKVIEAGKIIIGTNRADDETSIIRFVSSDKINIEQDFTSNKTDDKNLHI